MQLIRFWPTAVLVLACCRFTYLNALDISAISSFVGSSKGLSCYKCSTLTSSACRNISSPENHKDLIEECAPNAKGCVKQEAIKYGTKITFRECYYAKVSTFLFTNLVCEGIPRTVKYDISTCHKCSGNLCNSSNRLDLALSSWLSLAVLTLIAFLLRM